MTFETQTHYVELPASAVPSRQAELAASVAAFAAADMDVPTPRIVWIAPAGEDHAEQAKRTGRFAAAKPRPVNGLVRNSRPGTIFIELGATAETIAHETRHLAQEARGLNPWANVELAERDASEYARDLVSRWRRARADGTVRV